MIQELVDTVCLPGKEISLRWLRFMLIVVQSPGRLLYYVGLVVLDTTFAHSGKTGVYYRRFMSTDIDQKSPFELASVTARNHHFFTQFTSTLVCYVSILFSTHRRSIRKTSPLHCLACTVPKQHQR